MIVVVDPDQGPVTRRLRAQIGAAAHRRAVGLALGTVVPTTPAEQAIARPAQSKAMPLFPMEVPRPTLVPSTAAKASGGYGSDRAIEPLDREERTAKKKAAAEAKASATA